MDLKNRPTRFKISEVKRHYPFLSSVGVSKVLNIPLDTVRYHWPSLVKADEKAAGVVK